MGCVTDCNEGGGCIFEGVRQRALRAETTKPVALSPFGKHCAHLVQADREKEEGKYAKDKSDGKERKKNDCVLGGKCAEQKKR